MTIGDGIQCNVFCVCFRSGTSSVPGLFLLLYPVFRKACFCMCLWVNYSPSMMQFSKICRLFVVRPVSLPESVQSKIFRSWQNFDNTVLASSAIFLQFILFRLNLNLWGGVQRHLSWTDTLCLILLILRPLTCLTTFYCTYQWRDQQCFEALRHFLFSDSLDISAALSWWGWRVQGDSIPQCGVEWRCRCFHGRIYFLLVSSFEVSPLTATEGTLGRAQSCAFQSEEIYFTAYRLITSETLRHLRCSYSIPRKNANIEDTCRQGRFCALNMQLRIFWWECWILNLYKLFVLHF